MHVGGYVNDNVFKYDSFAIRSTDSASFVHMWVLAIVCSAMSRSGESEREKKRRASALSPFCSSLESSRCVYKRLNNEDSHFYRSLTTSFIASFQNPLHLPHGRGASSQTDILHKHTIALIFIVSCFSLQP